MRRDDSALLRIGARTQRVLALGGLGVLLGCSHATPFYEGDAPEHETAMIRFAGDEVAALDGRSVAPTRRQGRILPGRHEVLIRFAKSATAGPQRTVTGEGECRIEFVAEAGHAYRVSTDWEKRDLFRDDEGRPCDSEPEARDDVSEELPDSSGVPPEDDCASYKWAPIRRVGMVQDSGEAAPVGRCSIGG